MPHAVLFWDFSTSLVYAQSLASLRATPDAVGGGNSSCTERRCRPAIKCAEWADVHHFHVPDPGDAPCTQPQCCYGLELVKLYVHGKSQNTFPRPMLNPELAFSGISQVYMSYAPAGGVSVTLSLKDDEGTSTSYGTISPTTLSFSSSNYNSPQSVSVQLATASKVKVGKPIFVDFALISTTDWSYSSEWQIMWQEHFKILLSLLTLSSIRSCRQREGSDHGDHRFQNTLGLFVRKRANECNYDLWYPVELLLL